MLKGRERQKAQRHKAEENDWPALAAGEEGRRERLLLFSTFPEESKKVKSACGDLQDVQIRLSACRG